ncbi:sulfatase-like hydrolase/transferase [Chelativorans sp. Marseille-P2723]|uniref:sulfatase-like hydrolase/transferase n=1 Tax=Chelativorans sp. Marseille-P2723 TaxID=2709133 RepID=UPI0015714392|nr:sulfatase-like hydrolase/transferase [Chelativorans sp. Marseille-P2723]
MTDGSRGKAGVELPDGQTRKSSDRFWPFHPFLFAIASVMIMMARNLNHTSFADIAPSLAGVLIFALAAYLAVAALRRRFDALTAIIASIWIIGCLFFAGLFGWLNGWVDGGYAMVPSLPFALAILAALTVLAIVLRRAAGPIHTVLNVIAAVLLINPLWQVISYEWEHGAARAIYDPGRAMAEIEPYLGSAGSSSDTSRPPDVYHFIFDRYASEEVLEDYYGLDNSAIGRFLDERGFYVARNSHSNYQKTGHSLASTFYMDYLDILGDDPRAKNGNWHPIYKMLDDHRAARVMKSRGYDFIQFGSWWVGTYDNSIADENHPHGFNEFEMIYLRRTILRPLFHALPDTAFTMRLNWDNAQCQRVGAQVDKIKAIGQRDKPAYVFAHFLVPHGPYPFTPDGGCLTQKQSAERGSEKGYIDQIAYANRIIEELVTTLQERKGPPPIIIIQADEGPFPERDGSVPWNEAPGEELRIKTGIINAYYFPGKDYAALTPDITPVNSYRVLFNTYLGTSFPILPNRIFFFPFDSNLYEFHDMTEKVRGPAVARRMPERGSQMMESAP